MGTVTPWGGLVHAELPSCFKGPEAKSSMEMEPFLLLAEELSKNHQQGHKPPTTKSCVKCFCCGELWAFLVAHPGVRSPHAPSLHPVVAQVLPIHCGTQQKWAFKSHLTLGNVSSAESGAPA